MIRRWAKVMPPRRTWSSWSAAWTENVSTWVSRRLAGGWMFAKQEAEAEDLIPWFRVWSSILDFSNSSTRHACADANPEIQCYARTEDNIQFMIWIGFKKLTIFSPNIILIYLPTAIAVGIYWLSPILRCNQARIKLSREMTSSINQSINYTPLNEVEYLENGTR